MKFPTEEEFAKDVAEMALDEYEYKGKTLRQWIEIISNTELGTNLAEVGTDCISRQAAINAIKDEWDNCDYCHEDVDGYVKPIEKNGHAFVRFGMNGWKLELKAKGWHGETKIQYCPMCGRKLKK